MHGCCLISKLRQYGNIFTYCPHPVYYYFSKIDACGPMNRISFVQKAPATGIKYMVNIKLLNNPLSYRINVSSKDDRTSAATTIQVGMTRICKFPSLILISPSNHQECSTQALLRSHIRTMTCLLTLKRVTQGLLRLLCQL